MVIDISGKADTGGDPDGRPDGCIFQRDRLIFLMGFQVDDQKQKDRHQKDDDTDGIDICHVPSNSVSGGFADGERQREKVRRQMVAANRF